MKVEPAATICRGVDVGLIDHTVVGSHEEGAVVGEREVRAHVSYRRRGRALEITINRGVTDYELDTLFGKLGAHRVATHGAILYTVQNNSQKKVGNLDRINFTKLRKKIEDALDKYRVYGLLVQDTKARGALHKGFSHGMVMKENYRAADFGSK